MSRDDFYADAASFNSESLEDPFIVQRCAAAVAALERLEPPFAVDAGPSRVRLADALLNVLRSTNADATRPPTPLVSTESNLTKRLDRFAAELSALMAIAGAGSAAASWASTRLRALRGGDGAAPAEDLLKEIVRRPGLATPPHTGANLLSTPFTDWPDWMLRRAGLKN